MLWTGDYRASRTRSVTAAPHSSSHPESRSAPFEFSARRRPTARCSPDETRPILRRCSDTNRPISLFLPGNQLTLGGLKGRGALGEPRRSRRRAPRARESDALPVTQAEREPQAPSGSRRRAPTTAKGPPVPRPARAATPREDTTGRTAAEARRSEDLRSSVITKISDFRTTASRGQRGDGVASSRASGPCEAVSPPRIRGAERRAWPASRRRECRGLSGFLNPYLNTAVIAVRITGLAVPCGSGPASHGCRSSIDNASPGFKLSGQTG